MSLLELVCAVDDFWLAFAPYWASVQLADGKQRQRAGRLHPSERMTIVIACHRGHYRDFKAYYMRYMQQHLRGEFPHLVSYQRFVELMPTLIVPVCAYLRRRYGACTGLSFIDASALAVCDNHRIHFHKIFAGLAARGKTSMGWLYGFKIHLVTNEDGELLGMGLTAGNVDDRVPVPQRARRLFGKLFGERGYASAALFEQLWTILERELL